ncbi:MAG: ATP-binding cassette domain-containing protein [Balneolaceae bacterium]|nr:ATP-binding cassette domain-containing protein [Balneolaceae bacterium]
MAMIKFEEVSKIYSGTTLAVDSISFEVIAGETLGLIGTSGSGKTTILKMINRLIEPTSGEIYLDGVSIFAQPPEQLRRGMGYVIQHGGLFPHYTVADNIATVPRLLGWEEEKIKQRSDELLQLVGLDPSNFSHRNPDELSGGQQQRVGLARALAADPDILLMDEPFGALDPITKKQVRQECKKLLDHLEKTVILVTHDVFEAVSLCDRICLIDEGKIQQIGMPEELLFSPANTFVASFFDNHRLQLEMMSVSIGDLLEILEIDNRLVQDESLFSLIENNQQFDSQSSLEELGISTGDLFSALNEYKARFREANDD